MKRIFYLLILMFFFCGPSFCAEEQNTGSDQISNKVAAVNATTQENNTQQETPISEEVKELVPQSSINLKEVEQIVVNPKLKKISFDIKNLDIVDVLKMLAARAGLNIIVGKNVKAQVSMFIRDVDIWDAFEIILLANGLAYDKKGDLINVMTQEDYEKIYGMPYKDKKEIEVVKLKYAKAKELVAALTQVKSEVGKVIFDEDTNSLILMDTPDRIQQMKKVIQGTDFVLQTKIFDLNYANAEKISDKIKGMVTKGLGSIKIDERSGRLAITDTQENLDEIEKVIRAFDEKPRQVLIDSQIIELNPSDKLEMGIDWDYWFNKYFRTSVPFAGVSGTTKLSIGTVGQGSTIDEVGQYKAILDALRTIGDTKVLSSPRIMAVDGQEARILVGSKEAYLTSSTTQVGQSASTAQTVNFVDVGIKLYVTPQISREGVITMKIRPEISSSQYVDFGTAAAPQKLPIVTTSEAETTVVVNNGTTIIIGGLRKDSKVQTIQKIPILGDIPLLKYFARNISKENTTTELVILLTPHIFPGDRALTDFSELKPNDGVNLYMYKGELIKEKSSSGQDSK